MSDELAEIGAILASWITVQEAARVNMDTPALGELVHCGSILMQRAVDMLEKAEVRALEWQRRPRSGG